MRQIKKLNPVFHYRIWGGERIKTYYPNLEENKIGEAWITSCIEGSENQIEDTNLAVFWKENPEFFGVDTSTIDFPLLVKIIDAKDDLSIQVHPDNLLAQELENYPYGKNECWYILDAQEDTKIVYGLTTEDINDIKAKALENKWNDILNVTKVNEGEMYNIPSGLVHAIKSNNLILEVQQPCDLTYRLYDYDRLEANGEKRELHIDKGLQAIKTGFDLTKADDKVVTKNYNTIAELLTTEDFSVKKVDLVNSVNLSDVEADITTWFNLFVNVGNIEILGETLTKGDSILLSAGDEDVTFNGSGELFIIK